MNGSYVVVVTDMRIDPTFVWWYTHSFIVHPFFTTTVLPIVMLCCLNYRVYRYDDT